MNFKIKSKMKILNETGRWVGQNPDRNQVKGFNRQSKIHAYQKYNNHLQMKNLILKMEVNILEQIPKWALMFLINLKIIWREWSLEEMFYQGKINNLFLQRT